MVSIILMKDTVKEFKSSHYNLVHVELKETLINLLPTSGCLTNKYNKRFYFNCPIVIYVHKFRIRWNLRTVKDIAHVQILPKQNFFEVLFVFYKILFIIFRIQ